MYRERTTRGVTAGRAVLGAVALILVGVLTLVGCGGSSGGSSSSSTASSTTITSAADCPTSATTSLAKTKFALHAGLAFGTFHRYIYKPYQAGKFKKGASGRTLALVKAAGTAALDYREIKLASADVKADPTLCRRLAAPLARLTSLFSSSSKSLAKGDTSSIATSNGLIGQVTQSAQQDGNAITERVS
ncbi:MAG: hypothetical protein ACQSGP_16240 [Frankia sp.]